MAPFCRSPRFLVPMPRMIIYICRPPRLPSHARGATAFPFFVFEIEGSRCGIRFQSPHRLSPSSEFDLLGVFADNSFFFYTSSLSCTDFLPAPAGTFYNSTAFAERWRSVSQCVKVFSFMVEKPSRRPFYSMAGFCVFFILILYFFVYVLSFGVIPLCLPMSLVCPLMMQLIISSFVDLRNGTAGSFPLRPRPTTFLLPTTSHCPCSRDSRPGKTLLCDVFPIFSGRVQSLNGMAPPLFFVHPYFLFQMSSNGHPFVEVCCILAIFSIPPPPIDGVIEIRFSALFRPPARFALPLVFGCFRDIYRLPSDFSIPIQRECIRASSPLSFVPWSNCLCVPPYSTNNCHSHTGAPFKSPLQMALAPATCVAGRLQLVLVLDLYSSFFSPRRQPTFFPRRGVTSSTRCCSFSPLFGSLFFRRGDVLEIIL